MGRRNLDLGQKKITKKHFQLLHSLLKSEKILNETTGDVQSVALEFIMFYKTATPINPGRSWDTYKTGSLFYTLDDPLVSFI